MYTDIFTNPAQRVPKRNMYVYCFDRCLTQEIERLNYAHNVEVERLRMVSALTGDSHLFGFTLGLWMVIGVESQAIDSKFTWA